MNPRQLAGLEVRAVGDEVLVHDPANGKVHVLNATAGKILDLCDGTRSPGEIAGAVAAETGADSQTVSRDVERVLGEFATLDLLER